MKAFKNIISILISISVSAIMLTQSFAADDISVVLNGNKVEFYDVKPILYKDRTLIPVRAVFEEMGCYVDWDSANNMAIIGNEEKVIFVPINSEKMRVYDIASDKESVVYLDVPAMLINDRTMIPLRAVGEALDARVDWNESTETVLINFD